MARNKRKKKFIDPKVQGALMIRITLHYAIFFGTSCTFAFLLQVLADPLAPFSEHLNKLWMTQGPFLLVALCLLPIFMRDTVQMSHRFVGPILRVRNTIKEAGGEKDVALVKLRPGDYWTELADDLNAMLTRFQNKSKSQPPVEELVS